jgi:hypothetical protein
MPTTQLKPLTRQYLEDEKWVNDHIVELTRNYPDQWIAVLKGRVVAAGKDRSEVERLGQQVAKEAGQAYCLYELIESRFRFYTY